MWELGHEPWVCENILNRVPLLGVGNEDSCYEVRSLAGGGLRWHLELSLDRVLNQDHHLLSLVKSHVLGGEKGVTAEEEHEEDNPAGPDVDRLPLVYASIDVEEYFGGREESGADLSLWGAVIKPVLGKTEIANLWGL